MSDQANQNENGMDSAKRTNGALSSGRSAIGQQQTKKKLSPRETDIAKLVALGLSDKEIANELGLTEATVGWYLNEIFQKWQIHSRVALANCFLREVVGISLPSPPLTNVRVATSYQQVSI